MHERLKRPVELGQTISEDPGWYKHAVIYQTHVRAYADSDRDGVGDFVGLTEKLPYIRELGADVIWLLPFYPSPLRDGGYDIADYTDVHPDYGTMRDFRELVRAAHELGIRVMTELVLNHTSDQHPWFVRARHAPPESLHRSFYVWSQSTDKYSGARIIFKDFESSNWTWDPVAKAYYWHRFYSHQPDLNWDNPAVEQEMLRVLDFWLGAGVDGLRLDAVPYLFEREGTSCENLPETHAALKRIRRYVDQRFPGRVLLAEANQWPEDAVAYFGAGNGDECHMAFHFPLMPRLYMAMETEDRFPLVDIIEQTPSIPAQAQWTIFLRNHDELTLEMVSDEERDYMWRTFAGDHRARLNLGIRRRLAPLLGNDRRKIELLNALLFSFAGTPVIYYGDEIGMGDNIYLGDRDGVRTPMQWSAERNAGFSAANPQQLYLPVNIDPEYRYEAVNVEAQEKNLSSLYWWMKRAIALRRRMRVLGDGALEFLYPDNPWILAFLRRNAEEEVLVVANLSRSVQFAELELLRFEGRVPMELFGRTRFPPIGRLPYLLTLGPYACYWFDVSVRRRGAVEVTTREDLPRIPFEGEWSSLFWGDGARVLEHSLPVLLPRRRWFAGKARVIDEVHLLEAIPLPAGDAMEAPRLALVRVSFVGGAAETYCVPLAEVRGGEARRMLEEHSWAIIARLGRGAEERLMVDALERAEVREALLVLLSGGVQGPARWQLRGTLTQAFGGRLGELVPGTNSQVVRMEQSNSSIVYGESIILKLFRRVDTGLNPDLELGRFLSEERHFEHTPAVLGALELLRPQAEPITLGIAQTFVRNHGDAYSYFMRELSIFLDRSLEGAPPELPPGADLLSSESAASSFAAAEDAIGGALHLAELLGARTAELHRALGGPHPSPAFAPESFTGHYQRGLYQSMRALTARAFALLEEKSASFEGELREAATRVLDRRGEVHACFERGLKTRPLSGQRIRTHGDLHLGQVLFTGRDFVFIDFEGEPARPLGERRIKKSPLRDVAGMLRSFAYCEHQALRREVATGAVQVVSARYERLMEAARGWRRWSTAFYFRGYLVAAEADGLLPRGAPERRLLLDVYLLEKAIYELNYELNNRPQMVQIPIEGILGLLDDFVEGPSGRGAGR